MRIRTVIALLVLGCAAAAFYLLAQWLNPNRLTLLLLGSTGFVVLAVAAFFGRRWYWD